MKIYFTTDFGGCLYILFGHDSGYPIKSKGLDIGRLHLKYRLPCVPFPNGATGILFSGNGKKMPVNQVA